ncbi:hypothetical protein M0805_000636 [Coniferiporia weirii]|nr:hypothetical protein M0805_000636 [Coniferiporia weirii]
MDGISQYQSSADNGYYDVEIGRVIRNISLVDCVTDAATSVATLTVQLYDYLTSIDEEARLVWTRKFCISQLLFFLNRYVPFLTSFVAAYFTATIGMVVAEFTFFLRADAVWGHRRSLRALLFSVLVSTTVWYSYASAKHVASVNG